MRAAEGELGEQRPKLRAAGHSMGGGEILLLSERAGSRAERRASVEDIDFSTRVYHGGERGSAERMALGICFQWILVVPGGVIDIGFFSLRPAVLRQANCCSPRTS